jgi:hypothetical protein
MQQQMDNYCGSLRAEGKSPLAIRVGINTGEVVVRSVRKDDSRTDYLPVGHSTGLAERMQTLARPGGIVITDHTRRMVEGYFRLESLGLTKVKGLTESITIYEVMGVGPLRTRLQLAARRGLTKFVGREREMETLRYAAKLTSDGRGQMVAVVADAGTGKTRLFHEFKLISQSEWTVLEAVSVSHGKASAYLPVLELLRSYFGIFAEDDARKRRERVIGKILGLDRSLEDTLPYLFALLRLVEGDDPLKQMDAQLRRRRTHEALKRILLRESLCQLPSRP